MDKFDRKIIAALHENGRLSFAELARRVNLSAHRPLPTAWKSWNDRA